MPIVRFIGDVHGKYERYRAILENSPPSIQVGDLGVGFRRLGGHRDGEFQRNPPYYAMHPHHRFIRGNHDNPGECKKNSQYIPDGTIENDIMFIGGAVSIDKKLRTEGYSWWPDEELSTEELNRLVDVYAVTKPRIMVTHDCPESIAEIMVGLGGVGLKLEPEFASRTRQALQAMLEIHRPEIWLFGHWHVPFDQVINGTRFICLAELQAIDLEV